MREKITKSAVDALKPGEMIADTEIRGFVVRRLPSGVATYGLRYRIGGRQRWLRLGIHGSDVTAEEARKLAKKRTGEVADDRDPAAERTARRQQAKEDRAATVDALLDDFLERHVRRNLREAKEVERIFDKYVRPRIGGKEAKALKRSEVVRMLDEIEDAHGPVMADRALSHVSSAFNWHSARDDSFVPPIVKGMARTRPGQRARRRTLTDDEISLVWQSLDVAKVPRPFCPLVRVLLLTAQRRDEVANMRWEELDIPGRLWVIPAARRRKGHEMVVPLTDDVLALIGKPNRKGFVFTTTDGAKPFSGFSKAKLELDKATAKRRQDLRQPTIERWTLHDLRRTARSLMSRVGVQADIAERVLGHAIPGVRGIYDRYAFFEEKVAALRALSDAVARIVHHPD